MGAYIPFTEEQKLHAASVDLEDFLRRQGETLIRAGGEWRLASNHSVTVRANTWYDHAIEQGGNPVTFLRHFHGMSFPEAMLALLGDTHVHIGNLNESAKPKERPKFALPPAHTNMRRAYAYLTQQRGIDAEIVSHFARRRLVYESAEPSADGSKIYHNGVFVGMDENGAARHAHKFGLYTQGPRFRRNAAGSDPKYCFHRIGHSDRLHVFEAPIDFLSYITLHPTEWQQHSYVALCGVSGHALLHTLETHPHLRSVALCLDNDTAGQQATTRLSVTLQELGYNNTNVLTPRHKDWNDDVRCQQEHQHALEEPEFTMELT